MAQSPAHRFGQIIGEVLETAIRAPLEAIAREHGLYLDCKRPRAARGGKRKVCWADSKGNAHDLDYVIEQGGDENICGIPRAFIEIAWRRYTKHSRNKAQEIQGATIPLAETYRNSHPFLGVVLAGVFTDGSLNQLRSHGFQALYYSYEDVIAAFASVELDAAFDEGASDAELKRKVTQYEALRQTKREQISLFLRQRRQPELNAFLNALRMALQRAIQIISILLLHGLSQTLSSVSQAINLIESYHEANVTGGFIRYEISVRYTNGDEIRGQFQTKTAAVEFLKGLK